MLRSVDREAPERRRRELNALVKQALGRILWAVLGRTNLVRLARYLSNYARLDVPNTMKTNGELMLQEAVLDHAGAGRDVFLDVGANLWACGAWR